MRKIASVFLTIVLMFVLSSCTTTHEGIDEFHVSNSSLSLCSKLIPEGLLENYSYVDGDYFFNSYTKWKSKTIIYGDKTLMYLVYDNSTYASVKEHVFNNMLLDDVVFEELNGYVFYINLRYEDIPEERSFKDIYPYFYNAVAFNDDKNEIVFLGVALSPDYYEHDGGEEAKSNFASHLKHFYGEWYNFFD